MRRSGEMMPSSCCQEEACVVSEASAPLHLWCSCLLTTSVCQELLCDPHFTVAAVNLCASRPHLSVSSKPEPEPHLANTCLWSHPVILHASVSFPLCGKSIRACVCVCVWTCVHACASLSNHENPRLFRSVSVSMCFCG